MSYCSIVRVVHGASLLLDYGDLVAEPFAIDGTQIVEPADFLRALGRHHFARGNESHTVTWTAMPRHAGGNPAAGMRVSIERLITLPRTVGDLEIYINDGTADYFILRQAVIEGWAMAGDRIDDQRTISILGGQLEASVELDPGENWENQGVFWEHA